MKRLLFAAALVVVSACGSESPTSPSQQSVVTPPRPVYPSLVGAWQGTETSSALGISAACNMSWIVTGQGDANFFGTWQTSGANCGQAGQLAGTVSTNGAISDLNLTATIAPSPCVRVAGTGLFSGVMSANVVTAQASETIRCSQLPSDVTRSITLSMRRQ